MLYRSRSIRISFSRLDVNVLCLRNTVLFFMVRYFRRDEYSRVTIFEIETQGEVARFANNAGEV